VAGDTFGELALLYNAKRAASIVTKTKCILWELDRETFINVVKESAIKKREKYESFLKNVSIFKNLDTYEIALISDALKLCNFKQNEHIIKESEYGDIFYIIEEGTAVATKSFNHKKPVTVKEYKKGDYFGELALLKNQTRAANIIATVNLKIIFSQILSLSR
jgi:cAMP-dependent protein kinase regulator